MKLKNLLVGLEGLKLKGDLELEVEGIESNSKNIKPGFLFIAIKGFAADGHKFIPNAVENGATAIMIEEGCDLKGIKLPNNVTVVMAKNTRRALAVTSANFYGNPSKKIQINRCYRNKRQNNNNIYDKRNIRKSREKCRANWNNSNLYKW